MVKFLLVKHSWQFREWNQYECTVERRSDGKYAVVDHSIQTVVATADTKKEAVEWIKGWN